MKWVKIVFSAAEAAQGKPGIIRQMFELAWALNGHPKDAVLYSSRMPGDTTFYFSPAAAMISSAILVQVASTPCSAPDTSTLNLISAAWAQTIEDNSGQ